MDRTQIAASFMRERGQTADCIDASVALEILDKEISDGLEGRADFPCARLISPDQANGREYDCVVVDIGERCSGLQRSMFFQMEARN